MSQPYDMPTRFDFFYFQERFATYYYRRRKGSILPFDLVVQFYLSAIAPLLSWGSIPLQQLIDIDPVEVGYLCRAVRDFYDFETKSDRGRARLCLAYYLARVAVAGYSDIGADDGGRVILRPANWPIAVDWPAGPPDFQTLAEFAEGLEIPAFSDDSMRKAVADLRQFEKRIRHYEKQMIQFAGQKQGQ